LNPRAREVEIPALRLADRAELRAALVQALDLASASRGRGLGQADPAAATRL